MAGLRGLPSLSRLISVPGWVVRNCLYGVFVHSGPSEKGTAGKAKGIPIGTGVLVGPPRMGGKVGLNMDLRLRDQVAFEIKEKGPHTLGPTVNREDMGHYGLCEA